ncbi:kinesin-like protein KIF23 isoform X2 [Patella vulgata]|uniref:kinesin-like protein KIF23 isoform X2 n=1 Tax=Patella vulgata TaxID=6465 RepID=UPI00217F99B9|nr:kinesin-like protein KIF23 isoform X2 [Patella vulgata]
MKPARGKTPKKKGNSTQQDPVEVYCRIRPAGNPEDDTCIKVLSETTVQLLPTDGATVRNGQVKEFQYKFQHVFDEYTSQKAIYDYVALPMVEDLLHGKNGLLFTYGITSSGKTYTMTGTPQDQGILPRCLDVIFNSINELQVKKYVFRPDKMNGFEVQSEADAMIERQRREILPGLITPKTPTPATPKPPKFGEQARLRDMCKVDDIEEDNNYCVFVSYIEIYNNYVFDLLEELHYDPITGYRPPQSKILRTDNTENMYVHNCVEVEIKSPEEAFEVMYKGQKRRKVAHTALNAESSRSHSVFNIRLVQAPLDPRGEEVLQDPERVCISQLSLVDLAGSERSKRTDNMGDRLKEAGNINQSLMVLRTCIETLRENQKNNTNKMVPYRDSKVTHLFKNYFDGDGKVRMIVCVNPRSQEYEETIHVMKFAEMTQEVMVARATQVRFDIGLTPGRRKLHQQYKDAVAANEVAALPVVPSLVYSLGPSFPPMELLHSSDDKTLRILEDFLNDRCNRRHTLNTDFNKKEEEFRARLVEMEREYYRLTSKNEQLMKDVEKKEKDMSKNESKVRVLERKHEEFTKYIQTLERENSIMSLKLEDKNWKINLEKTERERMKHDFKTRLEMNNYAWEKNMDKAKQRITQKADERIHEREQKIQALKKIVNTPQRPTPAPKPRATPSSLYGARSETDVSNIGFGSRVTRQSAIPSAKSMHNLNQAGSSNIRPSSVRGGASHNTRYHRRSKSSSNAEVWLDHQPKNPIPLGTVMQPKMRKKRSVTKLEIKDTKDVSKYCLTHQEPDSSDEVVTKLYKGDVIPTAGGGTAVVFKDVETLKQTSPGNRRKRRSSCPQPVDFNGDWTDTEARCSYGIEGHAKRTKASIV